MIDVIEEVEVDEVAKNADDLTHLVCTRCFGFSPAGTICKTLCGKTDYRCKGQPYGDGADCPMCMEVKISGSRTCGHF